MTRFQVIAPTRPARTTLSVIASAIDDPGSRSSPPPRARRTPRATFSTAALSTAARGDSARVETLVAIEFAVSWKPFVKSKKSATTTTATSVRSSTYAFLTAMFATTFAAVSQESIARSSPS